jgi:hypothetical protein
MSLLAWCDISAISLPAYFGVLAISFMPSPVFHFYPAYISLLAWCDILAISLPAYFGVLAISFLPSSIFHYLPRAIF